VDIVENKIDLGKAVESDHEGLGKVRVHTLLPLTVFNNEPAAIGNIHGREVLRLPDLCPALFLKRSIIVTMDGR
jgi:hypothetical protein